MPQRPAESEQDYEDYLDANPLIPVGRAIIRESDQGQLSIPNLPFFEQGAASETGRSATVLYTLRIVGAQSEELIDFENPPRRRTAFFAGRLLRNLNPNDRGDIELTLLSEIAAKRNLIAQINELGPVNYTAVEAQVETYLASIEGGVLSNQQLEGLRRSITAEIMIREGAHLITALVDHSADGMTADSVAVVVRSADRLFAADFE